MLTGREFPILKGISEVFPGGGIKYSVLTTHVAFLLVNKHSKYNYL